jgi:hypothetical protein
VADRYSLKNGAGNCAAPFDSSQNIPAKALYRDIV